MSNRRVWLGVGVAAALLLAGILATLALGSQALSRATTTVPQPNGGSLVIDLPEIDSTLTSSASTVTVGTPFTLTVMIQDVNESRSVTEVLSGFDFQKLSIQSAQSDRGDCKPSATQLQCALGGMIGGNLIGVTIVVVPNTPGTYQFVATAGSKTDNSQPVSVNVIAATADVGVRVPTVTLAPKVGKTARAGIVVSNAGPLPVTAATLAITVPPQAKIVSVVPHSGTCTTKPAVTCELGAFTASESDLVVITLAGVKAGKGIVVATAGSEVQDGTTTNNSGSFRVAVPKPAPRPKPKH